MGKKTSRQNPAILLQYDRLFCCFLSTDQTELNNASDTEASGSPKPADSLLSTEWATMKRKEEATVSAGMGGDPLL